MQAWDYTIAKLLLANLLTDKMKQLINNSSTSISIDTTSHLIVENENTE